MVVFGQNWLYLDKVVLFGQIGCIWVEVVVIGKVVVFGQNWLYSDKVVVYVQNWFYS